MLGQRLVHAASDAVRRSGRIVETEAYIGPEDAASHARRGPRGRAAIMFGPPGFAYVYLIYGVYTCFNAVTEHEDFPAAVLVRAVEPSEGASGERGSGPGLVCRALRIERHCSGLDLTGPSLFLESAPAVPDDLVRMGRRLGVDYAGVWAEKPWRFWLADSPSVSRRTSGVAFDPDITRPGAAG